MTVLVLLLPHRDDLVDSHVASLAFVILQLQDASADADAFATQTRRAGTNDVNLLAD